MVEQVMVVVAARRVCKGAMEGRPFHYYELMTKVSRTKIEEASWHVTQFCGITKLHSSSFTLCPLWRGALFLCFASPGGCQRGPEQNVSGGRGGLALGVMVQTCTYLPQARFCSDSRCSVAPGHSWSRGLGAAGLLLASATISSRLL